MPRVAVWVSCDEAGARKILLLTQNKPPLTRCRPGLRGSWEPQLVSKAAVLSVLCKIM